MKLKDPAEPAVAADTAYGLAPGGRIRCWVAYASPQLQFCIELELPAGATVAQACAAARERVEQQSGGVLLAGSDPLELQVLDDGECGIFGRVCEASQRLRDGDRVELYRPLQVDPKESRRSRAESARRPKSPVR